MYIKYCTEPLQIRTTLRDVKLWKGSVLHSRFSILPQLCTRSSALSNRLGALRYFSASLVNSSEEAVGLLLSELSDDPETPPKTPAPYQQQKSGDSLIQDTKLFGRWRALLTDPARLAIETDFDRRGPAKSWRGQLLVDKFQHRSDLALWSCLLDYQKRVNGKVGVQRVWKGLWGRKSLYDVASPLAPMFWRSILEAALRSNDKKFLESIWIYSEWMKEMHGVKWPQLYSTMLTYFLQTRQHQQVLRWQLRLIPNFYPGADEFARLIRQFAHDTDPYCFLTLQSLYIVNPDHKLYDTLVPYLYNLGASKLAVRWRRTCVRHDDFPLASVSVRPFLRFLQAYFPSDQLVPEEIVATGDNITSTEGTEQLEISRELVNRIHGGTFGISVKNYNDRLGAKWFASSWVNLNTAISTISTLGIEQIGPLSLQSIALREGTSDGVLKRITQLQEQGISVVDSNYFQLVLYFARLKDDELLLDLLHCDLHPDVFDDLELQARLITSTAESEDWRTHRLLLAAKIYTTVKSARKVANALVRAHFLRRDQQALLTLLDDMKNMRIEIDNDQTRYIYESLATEAKSTYISLDSLSFYLHILRKLTSMEIPVPVYCWRKILFAFTRQKRVDDLEKVWLEIVDMFTSVKSSRPGFVPVHLEDIPQSMKQPLSGVENLMGVYIPLDLPCRSPLHPLRQIFDKKMLGTVIRYSFQSSFDTRGGSFQCGRVVRLLRMLHDRGLDINADQLAAMVKMQLVIIFGPGYPTKTRLQRVRANNTLTLAEMKCLLDEAWGEEFLPRVETLRTDIESRGHGIMQEQLRYLQRISKTRPRLRYAL
ncbi:hypothetical protein F4779DRAFT_630605 [Xylariaceae sp. FL0662B]|nr:hypothetical protein F4779DRAFT_630605 [Xylariaceae sp. FL0662B]